MKIFTLLSGLLLTMIGLDRILGPPLRAGRAVGRETSNVLDTTAETATSVLPGPARRISRDFLRGLGVLRADRSITPGPDEAADGGSQAAAPEQAETPEATGSADAPEPAAETDAADATEGAEAATDEAADSTEAAAGEPAEEVDEDAATEWLPAQAAAADPPHGDGERADEAAAKRAVENLKGSARAEEQAGSAGANGSGEEGAASANGESRRYAPRVRLGHVHLLVGDLDRSLSFYTDLLGFEVLERQEKFAFLSGGDGHRDLVLQASDGAGEHLDGRLGVHHVAFELRDEEALRNAGHRLEEAEFGITPIDHGISKAIYTDDPDGNRVEVMCDTSAEADGWDGTSRPLDLSALG